ncbi:hypothetical protein, partial [Burkholderia pseudomallei]|uniref:hypothetical protein n=2 Tax=Burkholderia pseudomallei TaxID=28450 RepID=UPI001C4CA59C
MPLAAARVFARRNMSACPPAAFRLLPVARGRTENDACLWRVAMSIANREPRTANRKPQTANRKPQTANRKPQTAN